MFFIPLIALQLAVHFASQFSDVGLKYSDSIHKIVTPAMIPPTAAMATNWTNPDLLLFLFFMFILILFLFC